MNNRFEDFVDADARLGTGNNCIAGIQADNLLNLLADAIRIRTGQVDFIENREHLEVFIDGKIDIGEGLSFDTLGRINDQQSTLTGRERTADFIAEVDMSRRVYQVQDIIFAVFGAVI